MGSAPSSSGTAGRGISTSGWAVSAPSGTPAFSFPDTKRCCSSFPTAGSMAVLTVAPSNVGIIEIPIIVADLIDALHS
jgi:hypothetical protein